MSLTIRSSLKDEWEPLFSAIMNRFLDNPHRKCNHEEIFNTFLAYYPLRERSQTYEYQYCSRCGSRNKSTIPFVSATTFICGSCITIKEVKKPSPVFGNAIITYRKGGDKLLNLNH